MRFKISLGTLKERISRTYFVNDGDNNERTYWPLLKERFPNCEIFWRHFVFPSTKRLELELSSERIRHREAVSQDIQDIAALHYSTFSNLVYSHNHLQNFGLSSFEDFYTHLVTTCDLAEEFLRRFYLLVLECTHQKREIEPLFKKAEFSSYAHKWYDHHYLKAYEDYRKKGKRVIMNVHGGQDPLDEYFKKLKDWKEYKRYSSVVRRYRNVIVHDIGIGTLIRQGGITLVPKKEKIQHYRSWPKVFAVKDNRQKLKEDFVDREKQMVSDIERLENLFNSLWDKPINDFMKLLLQDRNQTLLKKYNFDLT